MIVNKYNTSIDVNVVEGNESLQNDREAVRN